MTADAVATQERMMTKLTDSQLVVLSNAAARDDQTAVLPPRMMKAAALKVAASLVARKLMREVRAKAGAPVWREDGEGRGIALVITKTGLAAINADDNHEEAVGQSNLRGPAFSQGNSQQKQDAGSGERGGRDKTGTSRTSPVEAKRQKGTEVSGPAGSKQATIIGMLSAKEGASLNALVAATGWLPHTTRAVLTGLRKKGFVLERVREEGVSTYRITGHPAQVAA